VRFPLCGSLRWRDCALIFFFKLSLFHGPPRKIFGLDSSLSLRAVFLFRGRKGRAPRLSFDSAPFFASFGRWPDEFFSFRTPYLTKALPPCFFRNSISPFVPYKPSPEALILFPRPRNVTQVQSTNFSDTKGSILSFFLPPPLCSFPGWLRMERFPQ